jgi:predicted NAD-dependent protein-ADP-ribosyltransferase YbiA (DUF1768 family)
MTSIESTLHKNNSNNNRKNRSRIGQEVESGTYIYNKRAMNMMMLQGPYLSYICSTYDGQGAELECDDDPGTDNWHSPTTVASITFGKREEPYYELSNFYCARDGGEAFTLDIDDAKWYNVEHYFQAQKFNVADSKEHLEYYDLLKSADSPVKVFALARQQRLYGFGANWYVNNKDTTKVTVNDVVDKYKRIRMRSDWDAVKLTCMLTALRAKFEQNPRLCSLLLSTHPKRIVDVSSGDAYWGAGRNGKGENNLGKLLMRVRAELISAAAL